MSRWQTQSTMEAAVAAVAIWESAYADPSAWPEWNDEIRSAELDGPLGLGARAKVRFETVAVGTRLTNTIYIEGRLAWLWRRVLGPRAERALPGAQEKIVALGEGR